MIDRAALSPVALFVVALTSVLAAGCACVRHAPTEPVPTSPPAASSPVQPAPAAQVAIPKAPVPVAPATAVAQDRQPPKAAAVAVTPTPTPAVVPKAAPAPMVPKAAPAAAVPKAAPVVPPPAAAPLDLKSLEARLRQTRAIGMLTKLSLKNQVDDLVGKFRAYHRRQGTTTLADLRRNYDMLFMKVLSLLQDSDPSLARDIVRSRSAIWSILEDPKKFTESKLMAGATP